MEEGKGERYLAPGRQYGNALLRVRHQEEDSLLSASAKTETITLNNALSPHHCQQSCSIVYSLAEC